ncbi:unnamed protein product [Rotaria socialis]
MCPRDVPSFIELALEIQRIKRDVRLNEYDEEPTEILTCFSVFRSGGKGCIAIVFFSDLYWMKKKTD